METQDTGDGAPDLSSAEPKTATLAERVIAVWRGRNGGQRAVPRSQDVSERRLRALEGRTEHLEATLEGLQDAFYRHAVLMDKQFDELRRRTEPARVARDLDHDARRRGL